ncbi:MAG: tRNA(Ile)-lysidine synthetase, partial [Nitrospirae bacterium]
MRCRVCKSQAVIHLPRHNSAFCREHFIEFFFGQLKKAIHEFRMFTREDRILVCVSGGKDSLSLWHCLV